MQTIFGGPYYFDGKNPAIILSALISQIKWFRKYISSNHLVIRTESKLLVKEEIPFIENFENLYISPIIIGEKGGFFGALEGIAGGALIGFSYLSRYFSPFAPLLIPLGGSLLAGGISQLLSPTPYKDGYDESQKSPYSFDGAQNIATKGVPIPIVYGRFLVGSYIVSQQLYLSGFQGLSTNIPSSIGLKNYYKSPDSPHSLLGNTTKSKTIHVLSEGKIVGLSDGAKTLYLNDTKLQNDNGSNNFNGVSFEDRLGLDDQDKIPGFSGIANEVTVNVSVNNDNPVIRTITNSDVDRLVLKIYWRSSSHPAGPYWIPIYVNDVLYSRPQIGSANVDGIISPEIDISGESFPVDIKVATESMRDPRAVTFLSYTEFIDSGIRYSGTAIVGLTIDLSAFGSSLPTASFLIDGIIIKIPTNYNPESRTYTGIWDGNFKDGYSNNPAWVLYDLLTNDTYGMGKLSQSYRIVPNKYDLYNCAVYNDEMISDGMGGLEPRYQYNGPIIGGDKPYDALIKILSSFRANIYISGNIIHITQDRPRDSIKIVSNSNVIDGKFNYSSNEFSGVFSAVVVTYNNPESQYKQDQVIFEDMDLIISMGYKKMDVVAEGCTSKSQAYRYAKWFLYTQNSPGETVEYQCSLDHIDVRPNDIVVLNDDLISGAYLSGRILSFTGNRTFSLDRNIDMEADKQYQFMFISDNGQLNTKNIVRESIDEDESVNTITISEDFLLPVSKYSLYLVKSNGYIVPRLFSIYSISETENPIILKITAIEYDPNKYDLIESDIFVQPSPNSILKTFTTTIPKNVRINIEFIIENKIPLNTVTLSWDSLPDANQYEIQYVTHFGEEWIQKIVSKNELKIIGPNGQYKFLIRAIDSFDEKSRWEQFDYFVNYSNIKIDDVTNFQASRDGGIILFSWNRIDNTILDYYEIRIGDDWEKSHVITTTTNTQFIFSYPKSSQFMIKAVSFTGGYSVHESIVNVQAADNENIVYTHDELSLGWPGSLTNLEVGDDDKLYMVDINSSYTTDSIDIGHLINSRPSVYVDFDNVENSTIDEFAYAYPTLSSIPNHLRLEDNPDGISIKIQISYSSDNITYSNFIDYSGGFYNARYFKFKFIIVQNYLTVFPIINNITISFDSKNMNEVRKDLTVSGSGLTLSYYNTYSEIPSVSVSIIGGYAGDNAQVVKEINQSTFSIYDSEGVQKSGVIDVTINGY